MHENSSVTLPEVFPQRCRVISQQSVDQTKQLHDSFILSQILVALQQEHELMAITSCKDGAIKYIIDTLLTANY